MLAHPDVNDYYLNYKQSPKPFLKEVTPLKETYNQEYKTKLCNEGIDSTSLNPTSYATFDSLNETAQEIDFLTLVSRAEAAACAAHAAELAADQHRRT